MGSGTAVSVTDADLHDLLAQLAERRPSWIEGTLGPGAGFDVIRART